MKTVAALAAAAGVANAVAVFPRAGTCAVVNNVQTTFYGFPDNSPPSAQTSYSCAGRGYTAGGVGTYADPLTFATADAEFSECEIIYAPYLKKYLIHQDDCAECESNWSNGKNYHIDIWTGSSTTSGGKTQIDCEDSLTPNAQSIVRNPPTTLDVDSTALFSNGQCATSHTYNNAPASCAGGSSSGSAPSSSAAAPATSASAAPSSAPSSGGSSSSSSSSSSGSCAWPGHCAGATCKTENDCSGDMVCTSGKCANP